MRLRSQRLCKTTVSVHIPVLRRISLSLAAMAWRANMLALMVGCADLECRD